MTPALVAFPTGTPSVNVGQACLWTFLDAAPIVSGILFTSMGLVALESFARLGLQSTSRFIAAQ